ncbi:hypothetical protein TRFO_08862 [Tritrichomonas foetus]|uniref:Importin N-terminal domain-containing protein n=1 Tax=Tritrichomonas foetus TaxID=1144522 RepID=A0A1J4JHE4_9EUKA|nr:hypothetical protein TRFO_08862 [Tritrichomonas foetus]|eukprot:OHS98570.1 hypothetical protein TRFO_08862 [Tritrichomonas foetus]
MNTLVFHILFGLFVERKFELQMIVYKNPLSPKSNDRWLKNLTFCLENDGESQRKQAELLSKINFHHFFSDNLNHVKENLRLTEEVLKTGYSITSLPNFLIPQTIDLACKYPQETFFCESALNFIYYLCLLNEDFYINYLNDNIINFLISVAQNDESENNVHKSLLILSELISYKKHEVSSKVDGMRLLQVATQILDKCQNNIYKANEKIIEATFLLITNCLISFDYSFDTLNLIGKNIVQSSYPNEKDPNRIWQTSAIFSISHISFWRSEDYFLDYFSSRDTLENLINAISPEFEKLSSYIFCALDNIAFKKDVFALNLITHNPSIFNFYPPENWSVKSKASYYRPLITAIRRTSECRELNQGGELLYYALSTLQEVSQMVIPKIIDVIENQPFKIKKAAIVLLCQLINLNDSKILHTIVVGHINIIDEIIQLLDFKNPKVIYSLIKSIRTLCGFGDNVAMNTGLPNPFLQFILNDEVKSILDKIAETYNDIHEITTSISRFYGEIETYIEHQDIDMPNDEEFEIFI